MSQVSGPPAGADRLMTTAEVADWLRVKRRTVTGWARTGRLPSLVTPGGHRRIRESDVRAAFPTLLEGGVSDAG
jgi:excisionase family DNA binding protein